MSKSLATMARHPMRAAVVLALALALLGLAVLTAVQAHDAVGPEQIVAGFEVDHDQTAGTHVAEIGGGYIGDGDDWDTVISPGAAMAASVLEAMPQCARTMDVSDVFTSSRVSTRPQAYVP